MERSDVVKIMAVLRGAYPQFYRGIDRREAEDTIALWGEMFRGDPYELVSAAVKSLIEGDDSGFPPTIGKVKAKIRLLRGGTGNATEQEAWSHVEQAIRNSAYNSAEEYAKLPPELQKLVGSANQLRTWAMMPADELNTVVASNFQRSYRVVKAREDELGKLPQDVRAMLGGGMFRPMPDANPAIGVPGDYEREAVRRLHGRRGESGV